MHCTEGVFMLIPKAFHPVVMMKDPKCYNQLLSSKHGSSTRSLSFHKSIAKAVLKGLQELKTNRYNKLHEEEHTSSAQKKCDVPKGYLAVYVGEERQEQARFIVKTEHLHHPIFKVLLKRCEEEFQFCQKGALTIPCQIDLFQLLLWHIENNDQVLDSSQAEELVNLYLLGLPSVNGDN